MNYDTLSLMLADAPRYESRKASPKAEKQTMTTEQIFQSKLPDA